MTALTPDSVREEVLGTVQGWLPGYTDGISPQCRVRMMESGQAPVFLFEPTDWRDAAGRFFRVQVQVVEVDEKGNPVGCVCQGLQHRETCPEWVMVL